MQRLLIANRSEIAERIMRTAKELGITTVVGYSDSDRHARFVELADEAYAFGSDNLAQTYNSISAIMDLARRAKVDAIHPGYGFLSENPEFAQEVQSAGLTWVGPSPSVLKDLGDKISARRLAESLDISPIPGLSEPITEPSAVKDFAHQHGFPIVCKQADGGGGRGITAIYSPEEITQFINTHAEHPSAFFVERFISGARHIETQCARDSHGNFTVISTRDCSVQRRNQKLIEEAPRPAAQRRHRTLSRGIFPRPP